MKPLDFVKTPKDAVAIITEMNCIQGINTYSIEFLGGGNPTREKNSWWKENEGLIIIDSLPQLLARNLIHPFGQGKQYAINAFPLTDEQEKE